MNPHSRLAQLYRELAEEHERLAATGPALEENLISKSECAQLIGKTERTITNWCARRGMPFRRGHAGRIVFDRDEVIEWCKNEGILIRRAA